MPSHLARVLIVAISLSLASRLPAQAVPADPAGLAPARALGAVDPSAVTARCGLQLEPDGRLIGVAHGYHAEFGQSGVSYTPALGNAAPHDLPLAFEFTRYGRGDDLVAPSAATRRHDGLVVTYERGQVTETYEVRHDGVKQSFVFDRLPAGRGDVVVRGAIRSELLAGPVHDDRAAYTLPGIGGVTITGVVGIDAAGRRVQGRMLATADGLEFRLPAAFVDTAELPLVLDPTLGTQLAIGATFDDGLPDAAWDSSASVWLVVWQRRLSATNIDIRAQRVGATGTAIGQTISIESGTTTLATGPRVANINSANRFVIAYYHGGDVYARGVEATSGLVLGLTPEVVVASGANTQVDVEVGGEAAATVAGAFATWRDATQGAIFVRSITYVAGGTLALGPVLTAYNGPNALEPTISQSGGEDGRWLVCWTLDTAGLSSIRGRVLDRSGNFLTTATTIASDTVDCVQPAVDGDGNAWIVAYAKAEVNGVDRDVYARTVALSGSVLGSGAEQAIAADVADDERSPAVGYLAKSALIAWQDEAGSHYDIFVRSVVPATCLPCEGNVTIAITTGSETSPQIGTAASGGDFGSRNAALVWQAVPTAATGDVLFQTYRARHGAFTELGGGCGLGGSATTQCAVSPQASLLIELQDAQPNQACWALLGFDAIDHACGPCHLVVDPAMASIWTNQTNANGRAFVSLPIPAGVGGTVFYVQWLSLGSACAIGLETSNALQVGIENF